MTRLPTLLALLLVAGCGASPDRITVTAPPISDRQRIAFDAVELRDLALPGHAAADEITLTDASGRLMFADGTLWADTPPRAVSQALASQLARITGARVAAEPWPLESPPDARLELRFDRFEAEHTGRYVASGQYFVAVANDADERAGNFEVAVLFAPEDGAPAIAAARGRLTLTLAETLARTALR